MLSSPRAYRTQHRFATISPPAPVRLLPPAFRHFGLFSFLPGLLFRRDTLVYYPGLDLIRCSPGCPLFS